MIGEGKYADRFLRQSEEPLRVFDINTMYLNSRIDPAAEYDQRLRRRLRYPDTILGAVRDMEKRKSNISYHDFRMANGFAGRKDLQGILLF